MFITDDILPIIIIFTIISVDLLSQRFMLSGAHEDAAF
jgi:hypothetical protein